MYSIKNLEKTYYTNKIETHALNSVSFDLPDKGLIFVVGKSGSGKSTLFNIMASFDNATNGTVIYKDRDISTFTPEEADSYRNKEIGFVFQNNSLIERYSVRDNLRLVRDLSNNSDDKEILRVLTDLDIPELIDRYPSELSAGQLQRVAIARALLKETNVILADEPTGNVDSKTSKIILEIFKYISETKLVVVISHNLNDAKEYGDRIIELSDGILISDSEVNLDYSDSVEIKNNEIKIPMNRPLTFGEVSEINSSITSESYISFQPSNFLASTYKHEDTPLLLTKHHLSFKDVLKYSFKNIKVFSFILSVLMIMIITLLIGVSQGFASFKTTEPSIAAIKNNAFNLQTNNPKYDNVVVVKNFREYHDWGFKNTTTIKPIEDKTINDLNSINQKTYTLYNIADSFGGNRWARSFNNNIDLKNTKNVTGTLKCDMEYLSYLFGDENGEVHLLAGEIKEDSLGVILTDFFVDLNYIKTYGTYRYMIESDQKATSWSNWYADAIIDTGYKKNERLVYLMENYKNMTINELSKYDKEMNYIINHLLCFYTINPNFLEDYKYSKLYNANKATQNLCVASYTLTSLDDNHMEYTGEWQTTCQGTKEKWGEITLPYGIFTELFPEHAQDIEGVNKKDIELRDLDLHVKFEVYDLFEDKYFEKDYLIAYVTASNNNLWFGIGDYDSQTKKLNVNEGARTDEHFVKETLERNLAITGVYILNADIESTINYVESDEYLFINDIKLDAILRACDIVVVFNDVFFLAFSFCLVLLSIIIFSISFSAVSSKKKEIGIFKSIGMRGKDITLIFIINTLFLSFIAIIAYIIVYAFSIKHINGIIISEMMRLNNNAFMSDIKIVSFDWLYVLIDSLIILVIGAISTIIPLLYIRRLDPIRILRSKD